jgi:hypothetical protein
MWGRSAHQDADTWQFLHLLCAGRQRPPDQNTAEKKNKLPSFHSILSPTITRPRYHNCCAAMSVCWSLLDWVKDGPNRERAAPHPTTASLRLQTKNLTRSSRWLCANSCVYRGWVYSISSSARASSVGGTVRPRALAVLRLMTSPNFVAACTGRSAGLAP